MEAWQALVCAGAVPSRLLPTRRFGEPVSVSTPVYMDSYDGATYWESSFERFEIAHKPLAAGYRKHRSPQEHFELLVYCDHNDTSTSLRLDGGSGRRAVLSQFIDLTWNLRHLILTTDLRYRTQS